MTSSCIDIHRKQKFLLEIDAEKKNTNLLQNANELMSKKSQYLRKSKIRWKKAGYTATPVACGWTGAVF